MSFPMLTFLPLHALASAVVGQTTAPAVRPHGWLNFPAHWPAQADLLTWSNEMSAAVALLLVLLGTVYLLFGFHLFKPLVLLNAAFVGSMVGVYISQKTGSRTISIGR